MAFVNIQEIHTAQIIFQYDSICVMIPTIRNVIMLFNLFLLFCYLMSFLKSFSKDCYIARLNSRVVPLKSRRPSTPVEMTTAQNPHILHTYDTYSTLLTFSFC